MDSVDLKQLQTFVSSDIFEFLSNDCALTPSSLTTPTEAERATEPLEAELGADPLEAGLDALLLACSDMLEQNDETEPGSKRPRLDSECSSTEELTTSKRSFAPPETQQEIGKAKLSAIPATTTADTKYCVKIWNDWCSHRLVKYGDVIPPLNHSELSVASLAENLSSFIFEVRKQDGLEFPPDSLHHIVSGIQRYLRWNGKPGINIFKDAKFAEFRVCLDSEMKRLQRAGLGSRKKKAEPLTSEEEELLWTKGLLGSGSPQALVDTMVVMNGIYFALRSGSEHRQLRSDPCQIQIVENPGERAYLVYTEDISKNRPGGLKCRKLKPKIVHHYNNPQNPDRCFVRPFKLYQQLLPTDRPKHAFYFQPLKKPSVDLWFSNKPIGHNALNQTVARLSSAAGIRGFRTNHSLRATAATRLYRAGVDEQLIMERTGHRSLGVRSYKHTSESQKEALSDILNAKPVVQTQQALDQAPAEGGPIAKQAQQLESLVNINTGTNNHGQVNVQQNIRTAQSHILPPTFNFHSCTMNINYSISNSQ